VGGGQQDLKRLPDELGLWIPKKRFALRVYKYDLPLITDQQQRIRSSLDQAERECVIKVSL